MIKLIIFDCDGTIINSEIIATKVFPKVWAQMGVEISEEFFLCNFVGVSNGAPFVREFLTQLPPDAMKIADQKLDEELELNLHPVDGIPSLLNWLRPRKEICVASNSSLPYLQRVLAKTDLISLFSEKIFSAHQVERPKPSPDLFLYAAQKMGVSPEECLVIEDSVSGIKAAKAAGTQVVGFMGGLHFKAGIKELDNRLLSAGANYYVYGADELKLILEKI